MAIDLIPNGNLPDRIYFNKRKYDNYIGSFPLRWGGGGGGGGGWFKGSIIGPPFFFSVGVKEVVLYSPQVFIFILFF